MADKVDFGPRLGADPELFVKDKDGKIVPICGKVGGTKENPVVISKEHMVGSDQPRWLAKSLGEFAYQEDNVMFEFNIPGCADVNSFVHSIKYAKAYFEPFLRQRELTPHISSVQKFSSEVLKAHPQAMTVGCSPDFDAYLPVDQQERKPFSSIDLRNTRFCGGHLHLQYNKGNVPPWVMAQLMDLVVSLPFLAWDKQGYRREFYGKPGIYREKLYGLEYRTPSNFWLKEEFVKENLAALAENCFELGRFANERSTQLKTDYARIPWGDVAKAITNEDKKLSQEILQFVANSTSIYINFGSGAPLKRRNLAAIDGAAGIRPWARPLVGNLAEELEFQVAAQELGEDFDQA